MIGTLPLCTVTTETCGGWAVVVAGLAVPQPVRIMAANAGGVFRFVFEIFLEIALEEVLDGHSRRLGGRVDREERGTGKENGESSGQQGFHDEPLLRRGIVQQGGTGWGRSRTVRRFTSYLLSKRSQKGKKLSQNRARAIPARNKGLYYYRAPRPR